MVIHLLQPVEVQSVAGAAQLIGAPGIEEKAVYTTGVVVQLEKLGGVAQPQGLPPLGLAMAPA